MYQSKLSVIETEEAIKTIKDSFEVRLSASLNLRRISAPLFVETSSGLNDHLNGVEKPLVFTHDKHSIEIVQSLAKWKRDALHRYEFDVDSGLYTDMNAIRPTETLDETHSIYVDQWDWEKVIHSTQRTIDYLQKTVSTIYKVFLSLENTLLSLYPQLNKKLPDTLTFIDAERLRQRYPDQPPHIREKLITKEKKAVFVQRIGHPLGDGRSHDQRSPDYDDWHKNGDLLFWHAPIQDVLEISSMGIRVDGETLKKQLQTYDDWPTSSFHKKIINDTLPLTVGGGIGQSRVCMFILEKQHIGEVQATYWPASIRRQCEKLNIPLL